jgi:Ras-related protein Rab-18
MRKVKLVVVGDSAVGKTSILLRATTNSFDAELQATMGVQHEFLTVESNGAQVDFTIWDTAG